MNETSPKASFETLMEILSPRVRSPDPLLIHGMLTAAASTMIPELDAIMNDIAPGCDGDREVEAAVLGAIEEIADALPLSEHAVPVEEGAADEGERWLRGYLRGVAIQEDDWAYFAEASETIRDALAMCRALLGEDAGGLSLPSHIDPEALLGSARFLEDMAARIHGAGLEADAEAAGLGAVDRDDLPQYDADDLAEADDDALIELLLNDGDRLPRGVVDECVRRGDAIVPALQALIKEWDSLDESDEWWSILHAAKILGLIPGPAASAALLEALVAVNETDSDMLDWLVTDWPRFFRDRGPETFEALKRIGEDRAAGWFLRSTAVQCVLAQACPAGAQSLDSALDWVADLVSDRSDDDDLRFMAALHLCDFPRERHRALLESVASEQAGLPPVNRVFGPNHVDEAFRRGDQPEWGHLADPWDFYDDVEILERQVRWAQQRKAYDENYEDDEEPGEFVDDYDDDFEIPAPVQTFVREQPKVGRNDPCPCGSGKKYKKCCLGLQ